MELYPSAWEDVPASQIYMGKDVRKYGLLKKKTGGKKIPFIQDKYDQRFVIINKGWVYYYKDKSSEKPQGKFSLQGFSNTVINAEEEEATMSFVFKIYSKKANERTWYFATEIKLDMEQWMEAFRLEIEQYNVRGIPNMHLSKSCPVIPLHHPRGMPHLDINNERPQSAHTQAPMHGPLVGSQCSSRTDMTSGIGSSTQSIDEDCYEPANYDYMNEKDDDEFDTDSEADGYESPLSDTAPHSHVSFACPLQKNPFPKYEPPPAVPPRHPFVASSASTQHSRHSSICEELKTKMVAPTSRHTDVSTAASSLHTLPGVLSISPNQGPSIDDSNCHRLPPTPTSYMHTLHTLPPSRPTPLLLPGHHPVQFRYSQNTRNESSPLPVHTRPRSEDPSERASKQPQQYKRHSSSFAFKRKTLAEQLATKFVDRETTDSSYKSSSPRKQFSPHERKALSPLPLHIGHSAPVGPEDLPARRPPEPPDSNPSHFQHILSPTTSTPLHNILGYSKNGTNKPCDFGVPRRSSPGPEIPRKSPTVISQNQFSPLPLHPTYPQTQVPALPPKPSTPNDLSRNTHFGFGMPPFKSHPPNEQYAYYPDNYDDTADLTKSVNNTFETGVYDIPQEDSLYESHDLEPGDIEEIIYEQEQTNSKPLSPTPPLKPGKRNNMIPLLPQKPVAKQPALCKVNQQSGTANSWKSGLTTSNCTNLNGKMTTVVEHAKPTYQPKLRSPPHEATAGNKPPYNMAPLLPQKPAAKPPALCKVDQQSGTGNSWKSGLATSNCTNLNGKTTAVVERTTKPKLRSTTLLHEAAADNKPSWMATKLRTTEGSKVAAATASVVGKDKSRLWVKDPTDAVSQNPVNVLKPPLHKEEQHSGKKIMGSKVPTSGVGSKPSTSMRPLLPQKPWRSMPAVVTKPSPRKPTVKGNKPTTPQKNKPSVAHTSQVANMLNRFAQ